MDTFASKLKAADAIQTQPVKSTAAGKHRLRIILAGAIGNVLEWYDFGLYGLLASLLVSLYFPGDDQIAALLGVYGGFAIGL